MSDANLKITLVGGPTALLEIHGFRLLTDPTFDPAGSEYPTKQVTLKKLAGPALGLDAIGSIDAVLLSHDHHFDNLDHAGRAMLAQAPRVLTTPSGSERLGSNAVGLKPWQSATLSAPGGQTLRITATPARHGPAGIEPFSGEVTGFLLAFDGHPNDTVFFSGDTVWFEGVEEVARRFNVSTVVLAMGAARVAARSSEPLTMTTNGAILTAQVFPKAVIVPVHFEGWAHFSQGRDEILKAFADAELSGRLRLLKPGQSVSAGAISAGA